MSSSSILLVEDTPSLARLYDQYLEGEDLTVKAVGTGKEALTELSENPPEVVLLDLKLPDMDGLDILKEIRSRELPCEVVVITAHGSINVAVEAMRAGAHDFLVKPFNADRLLVTVRNAIKHRSLSAIVEKIKGSARDSYFGFIGSSLAMQALYRTIDATAASKATVFITGESGSGKEIAAEAIHRQSPRKKGPFIVINCGAIPKDLMESEIFGHVKGAFTGAHVDREGAASRASGGTLFLDEICEMDLALQTKLLRFVQTGTFQKVGGSKTEKVDARFVCATNRDPLAEVEEGNFREDLYYRLHVIPIHLPPLRERDGDVIEIARHFLTEYAAEEGKAFKKFDNAVEQVFDLQTKLLRFVQTGTFQKVGGSKTEKVDARFVCATNRDPLAEVEEGNFREDLYYRLHVIPIHLPPLRERDGDVIEIARHFLTEYAAEEGKAFKKFDNAVEQVFASYNWPGNIRQMQNVIRNVVVLHDGG